MVQRMSVAIYATFLPSIFHIYILWRRAALFHRQDQWRERTEFCTVIDRIVDHPVVRRWVKNYPHYRCSCLYCWLGMTKYTWSTPLLPLWCRCDLDSPFLSWVFCHKHGHSQFHLHQRRAEGSDPFLWAEGVPGVQMQRMMSVQYGNSVMSQRIVC